MANFPLHANAQPYGQALVQCQALVSCLLGRTPMRSNPHKEVFIILKVYDFPALITLGVLGYTFGQDDIYSSDWQVCDMAGTGVIV